MHRCRCSRRWPRCRVCSCSWPPPQRCASCSGRFGCARALGKLGPAAVAPRLDALTARRPVPADIVTMALVHAGAAGADDLIGGLDPARPARVRAVAAELLGQLGVLSAAASLATTLGD